MTNLKQIVKNARKIPNLLAKGHVVNEFVLKQLRIHPPDCIREQSVVVETQTGVSLRFIANQHMPLLYTIEEVIGRQCYTKRWDNLASDVKRGGVVIDIGANIGIFSIFVSSIYGCKVYAFEMDRFNFEILKSNVELNSSKCNVNCYNQAVTAKCGVIKYVHAYDFVGSRVVDQDLDGQDDHLVAVSSTLDDLFQLLAVEEQVSLLKMDCEGSEYEIILTADSGVFRKIKRISLEYHINYAHSQLLLKDMIGRLRQFYHGVYIEHDELRGNLGMIYAE